MHIRSPLIACLMQSVVTGYISDGYIPRCLQHLVLAADNQSHVLMLHRCFYELHDHGVSGIQESNSEQQNWRHPYGLSPLRRDLTSDCQPSPTDV